MQQKPAEALEVLDSRRLDIWGPNHPDGWEEHHQEEATDDSDTNDDPSWHACCETLSNWLDRNL